MAVTASWYGKALANLVGGETEAEARGVDWLTNTIKVALVADTYTPNIDTDEFWGDVSANEASGSNYTAGGATLGTKTVTYDAANNRVDLDAADVVWANATVTARYAVIYNDSPGAGSKNLLGYVNFGQNETATAGNFTITWATGVILRLAVG